jgi:plastocyanin
MDNNMKTQVQYNIIKCLCSFLAIFCWYNTIVAQTTHEVTVSNGSFAPANLTIAVGDIVKWTNTEGSHSVDGTTATFPSNPASFGNDIGTGWTYSFTFNTEGMYDYRCGVHTTTMKGEITVGTSTGVDDVVSVNNLNHAYPNPARNVLHIPLKNSTGLENKLLTLKVYNLNGKIVAQSNSDFVSKLDINIETLKTGVFTYEVSQNGKIIQSEKFVVK